MTKIRKVIVEVYNGKLTDVAVAEQRTREAIAEEITPEWLHEAYYMEGQTAEEMVATIQAKIRNLQ